MARPSVSVLADILKLREVQLKAAESGAVAADAATAARGREHRQADDELQAAEAGWREALARSAADVGVVLAWSSHVSQSAAARSRTAMALAAAEADQERAARAWAAATVRRDAVEASARQAARLVRRRREEQELDQYLECNPGGRRED